jgi:hypothetical protein
MATEGSTNDPNASQPKGFMLSVDWLAVITALVLIGVVLLGVSISW